jgi:membrane protease YdiL (CAAX protease family)
LFWLAVAAAPVCWLALNQLGMAPRGSLPAPTTVLLVVIVSPVVEEIVFRGGLQSWLLRRQALQRSFAGISIANILTSVVFAALHLFRQSPLWAALIFLPSLVFGWARERHGNVHSPILLHVFYNAGFLWLFG